MRWVACLVLGGCGLTLDLTPPEEDGGVFARRDGAVDAGLDAQADAPVDVPARDVLTDTVLRPDGEPECMTDLDCFRSDCVVRGCESGTCIDLGPIDCAPIDECHDVTGTCLPDNTCEQVLIDADGDGHAAIELGECGTDCDDFNAFESRGIVCGEDLDDDDFGSQEAFFALCGEDIACPEGYVEDRSDCWDDLPGGFVPGPDAANPDANERFFAVPRGNGTFDWNCDGMITAMLPRRVFGDCTGMDVPEGRCQMQTGWRGPIPGCGERELFTICESVGGRCAELPTVLQTQTCR